MKKETVLNLTLIICSSLLVFHFGILFKIIPYEIVWGGRLTSDEQMYMFEGISITLNSLLIILLLLKSQRIKVSVPIKFVHAGLWAFFGLFALNSVGNLLAETTFEKFFSIITILLTVNLWMIIKGKENEDSKSPRKQI
jgi:hypothetical protein